MTPKSTITTYSTSKSKLFQLLEQLPNNDWCTESIYISQATLENSTLTQSVIPSYFIERIQSKNIMLQLQTSDTGIALFIGEKQGMAILPPFPILSDCRERGFQTTQLKEILRKKYTVGVVLVRLGRFGLGILQGNTLKISKTSTRYVKNRHKAGGQSQRRFERNRERLIKELYGEICTKSKELFKPFEDHLDYILFGGDDHVLRNLLNSCPYLSRLENKMLHRKLAINQPNQKTLENIAFELWKSKIIDFQY